METEPKVTTERTPDQEMSYSAALEKELTKQTLSVARSAYYQGYHDAARMAFAIIACLVILQIVLRRMDNGS